MAPLEQHLSNTMRHERIELHITTRVSWILEPFLLAGDQERWENSRLHDCLAIILLHADIREIANLQGINQITEINVMSPLLELFFQFVERELHTGNVVQKNAIETDAGDLSERFFHEFLSMAGIEVPLSLPRLQFRRGDFDNEAFTLILEFTFEHWQKHAFYPLFFQPFFGEVFWNSIVEIDRV